MQLHRADLFDVDRQKVSGNHPDLVAEIRALHHRSGLEREHRPIRTVAAAMGHRLVLDVALDVE